MKGLAILIIAIVVIWLIRTARRPNTLKIGQPAPDFSLPDQQGVIHSLADFKGRWLVLYFYPKDDTPGCTKQACTFQHDLQALDTMGATVIGISVDNTDSHDQFAKKYGLDFPLLADTDAEVTARYKSLINMGVTKMAKRNTFLIDPQGEIAQIYLSANPKQNAADVIKDLKELQAT